MTPKKQSAIPVKGKKILLKVRLVLEDALFLVSTGDDMIERTNVFDTGFSCHAGRVAEDSGNVNNSTSQLVNPVCFS